MTIRLEDIAGAEAAARALAEAVAQDLRDALRQRERALLLVSGGRSPLPFFAALRELALPWERIDVSLVDERAVPPDHPDSNAALVARHLLTGAAGAARWIPLVHPGDAGTPWEIAGRAAERANHEAALAAPDAIVLGMGADGHTASLFPDSPHWPQAARAEDRYVPLQPGQAPHARVGLSLHALAGQRRCYLWTGGESKMDALRRAMLAAANAGQGRADEQALLEAGPVALLIAQPTVTLHVFHAT